MNEHNHHRIIKKLAENVAVDIGTLMKASDFSDDFRGILKTHFGEDPTNVTKEAISSVAADTISSVASSAPQIAVLSANNPIAAGISAGLYTGQALRDSLKTNKDVSELYFEITDEKQFYYYHFYYEIHLEEGQSNKGKITLKRITEDDDCAKSSFSKCILGDKEEEYAKNMKLFFTAINNREAYYLSGIGEGSNQSNCVAFLHAMSAQLASPMKPILDNLTKLGVVGSIIHPQLIPAYLASYAVLSNTVLKDKIVPEANPKKTFKEHLMACFSEYLFIENEQKALFMLGIALHGIMDSFTPSHTSFQLYTEQNMALHAQGDVLPIDDNECEKDDNGNNTLHFVPGQYNHDTEIMKLLAKFKKGYDDDDFMNDLEYEMLRSFMIISHIAYKATEEELSNEEEELSIIEIDKLCLFFKENHMSLTNINTVLSEGFTYGKNAYELSNLAISCLTEVYTTLFNCRNSITTYQNYKDAKRCCSEAIKKWENDYNSVGSILPKRHLNKFKRKAMPFGIMNDLVDRVTRVAQNIL